MAGKFVKNQGQASVPPERPRRPQAEENTLRSQASPQPHWSSTNPAADDDFDLEAFLREDVDADDFAPARRPSQPPQQEPVRSRYDLYDEEDDSEEPYAAPVPPRQSRRSQPQQPQRNTPVREAPPRRNAPQQPTPAPRANPQNGRNTPPPKRRHKKQGFPFLAMFLVVIIMLLLALVLYLGLQMMMKKLGSSSSGSGPNYSTVFGGGERQEAETTEPPPPETTLPVPEHVVSTATLGAMGDLLMHMPVVNTGLQSDGSYNFSNIFKYLAPTLAKNDVNIANLETTLAGTSRAYSGFPNFNCPDAIVSSAKEAGFGMLMTANNHCFDTGMDGYQRTLQVTKEMGVETIGTMSSADDPKYIIKEVNGIKIGMLCYTYETTDGTGSYPALNGLPMYGGSYDMINTFVPSKPQKMYDEVTQYLQEMKEAGADVSVMFIHWGVEYLLYANDNQKAIAQKLCDLGVDVIVGGHPHVVEPMALLESTTDPDHKTICIYSLGNAVSNQRLGNLSMIQTAHTEDGVLFTLTLEKYSDGKVYIAGTNAIPTWVNLRTNGTREYNILPLDDAERANWTESFNLSETMYASCERSYTRTMNIVGEGLLTCQNWLNQQKNVREAYYYDLAFFPEKFLTEPTEETVPETTALETETAETTVTDAA